MAERTKDLLRGGTARKKTYNVCWSGGLDSTLVVTQLSRFPVTIRPFYIKGQTFRLSEPQELKAVAAIRELLLADPRTRAELLPLEILEKNDPRIKDREIVAAHRRIHMRLLREYKEGHGGKLPPAGSQQIYSDGTFISPQYVPCASLAKYYGEDIEIGFICDDYEKNIDAFNLCSSIVTKDEETGRDVFSLCEENSDQDLYTLFKGIRFPLVGQRMHKRDVWQWYEKNNYLKLRSRTIFCQAPVVHDDGTWEPCGICTSCIEVIHDGLLEPFTEDGFARYRDYVENHEKEPERFRLKGF